MYLKITTKFSVFTLALLFIIFAFQGCNKQRIPSAWKIECYSFDQKQCFSDEWAARIPMNLPDDERKEKMMNYLEFKDIDVIRVGLKVGFHETVCSTCDICPFPDRYFMEINDKDPLKLKRLRLLNLAKCDCKSF